MDRLPCTHASCTNTTPPHDTARAADSVLSLLGGRVRLSILRILAQGPSSVGDIATAVGASIGLVSHNLRQLRDAGLVTRRARARQRIYTLAETCSLEAADGLHLRIIPAGGGHIEVALPPLPPPVVQTRRALTQDVLNRTEPGFLRG